MTRTDCIGHRNDEGHLLACPACRADARIATAWKGLAGPEAARAAQDRFVERVVARLARDRETRVQRRWLAAAAAAAVFAFCAGYAHERATGQAATPTAEESYASLAAPSALADLVSPSN
jgi:hypothetical protein